MRCTLAVLAFTALSAIAGAQDAPVDDIVQFRTDMFYPLPDSPDATTLIGDLTLVPDSPYLVTKWHAYELIGGLATACNIMDGVCCPCNRTAKGTPECGFVVRWRDDAISAECTQKIWTGLVTVPIDRLTVGPAPKTLRKAKKPKHGPIHVVRGIVMRHGIQVN